VDLTGAFSAAVGAFCGPAPAGRVGFGCDLAGLDFALPETLALDMAGFLPADGFLFTAFDLTIPGDLFLNVTRSVVTAIVIHTLVKVKVAWQEMTNDEFRMSNERQSNPGLLIRHSSFVIRHS
jgi:hypothetical protein